jgi:hypothetical protein
VIFATSTLDEMNQQAAFGISWHDHFPQVAAQHYVPVGSQTQSPGVAMTAVAVHCEERGNVAGVTGGTRTGVRYSSAGQNDKNHQLKNRA